MSKATSRYRLIDQADYIADQRGPVSDRVTVGLLREGAEEIARLRAELATAEAERDELRETWMFMRDCILNEMGPLEVNDVLSIIDSYYPEEPATPSAPAPGEGCSHDGATYAMKDGRYCMVCHRTIPTPEGADGR